MSEAQLLSAAFFIYVISGIAYGVTFFKPVRLAGWIASLSLLAALVLHGAALLVRSRITGHAPFSNMYESLVFFSWAFSFAYFLTEYSVKNKQLGFFAVFLNITLLMYAFSHDPSVKPLMPALQSNWLVLHVTSCFLSYGAFGVSFLVSLIFLSPLSKRFSEDFMDNLIYKLILFGFPLLSFGVISGAIWANDAWGTYWSWDPKETWALITWFIYALYLHLRLMKGWSGKKMAWIALGGFLSVIFTYLGVAYLLPGLHSYA